MPSGTQGPRKGAKRTSTDPDYNLINASKHASELGWDQELQNSFKKYAVYIVQKEVLERLIKWICKMVGGEYEDKLVTKMKEYEEVLGDGGVFVGNYVVSLQRGIEKSYPKSADYYETAFRDYLARQNKSNAEIEDALKQITAHVLDQIKAKYGGFKYWTADKLKITNLKDFVEDAEAENIGEKVYPKESLNLQEGVLTDMLKKALNWFYRLLDKAIHQTRGNNKKLEQELSSIQEALVIKSVKEGVNKALFPINK